MTLIAYHASKSPDLKSFDLNRSKSADYGTGIYLASTKEGTYGYGSYLYKIEVNISNPYVVENSEQSFAIGKIIAQNADVGEDYLEPGFHPFVYTCDLLVPVDGPNAITKAVIKAGYDGLIVKQEIIRNRGAKNNTDYIVAFSPAQIVKIEKLFTGDDLKTQIAEKAIQILKQKPMDQRDLWNALIDANIINSSSTEHSFMLIDIIKKLIAEGKIKKDFGILMSTEN